MKEIFDNVMKDGKNLYTVNMDRGSKVYGEKLVAKDGAEMREWDPSRSKLGAAICNGLEDIGVRSGSIVLYLGASTGTTVSHVSDIVGESGTVYALEFAERVFRNLLVLSEKRKNILPLMADVRKPETYKWIEEADVVFTDISQPDETQIAVRNANEFLKKGGFLMIAVKSQSIDVTKQPEKVYAEEKQKLQDAGFDVVRVVNLEPYEEKHAMIVAKK